MNCNFFGYIHFIRIASNYESLPLYACEVSVDDEPSFIETLGKKRENTVEQSGSTRF